ncbi:PhzF family phenazine biosynthesis protein [uncultured Paludibaculum sp.]|uniref:PhzF family phenazine biosynthesis protein n=1 Tax=uncultured Paludibaculum sp. TaxID=1765020 RepID=UPI002AAB5E8E|nr:PhzF family phenazine biosynthesis protein [uncultured Paludibaculum sp.]
MELLIYQVDAFSGSVFSGNPAAVCPLPSWLPAETMQAIAAENNLAETAFFVNTGPNRYHLRWFTPAVEMDLCGHATLASAYIIFRFLQADIDHVAFDTMSGELTVQRRGDRLEMDFPARPPEPIRPCPGLVEALGGSPRKILAARDYFVVYDTEEEIHALQPDMAGLCGIDRFAVIVTAPSSTRGVDFVSRFFAPAQGVAEDPVTGSAHCTLIPYWAERLGKAELVARQVSKRGGTLFCALRGERVSIAGEAALYLRGSIEF